LEALVNKTRVARENAIVAYFRSTRAEIRKVRWPTLEQGWMMTQIVLAVTFAMAVFLGLLDFGFGWLLGQVIGGNVLFMIVGAILAAVLIGAVYLLGQAKEV
jgi:preprotein translocase subunit SecE